MAELTLPAVFSNHAVLQREQPIQVWGKAAPGTQVTVELDSVRTASATADGEGRWRVALQSMVAGGPYELRVTDGQSTHTLLDVLVGEVWVCAGQSNMEMWVRDCDDAENQIATADRPQIRHLNVPHSLSAIALEDQPGRWQVCQPQTVSAFTAVGYHFARRLQDKLGVPIGLLNSTWGGTRIEPWISPTGLARVPSLKSIADIAALRAPTNHAYQECVRDYLAEHEAWAAHAQACMDRGAAVPRPPMYPLKIATPLDRQEPTVLHNAMLHPLIPYTIRGVIWYQGEANRRDDHYVDKTRALVEGWRQLWRADLPYYYVQIAPGRYNRMDPDVLPRFWMQQARIEREIPNSSMTVIHDVGDPENVHPPHKQAVGQRLANQALTLTYRRDVGEYKGPRFRKMSVLGNRVRIVFDHVGAGLASRDDRPLSWFELCGHETQWVKAQAEIVAADTVEAWSGPVEEPVAVRFAWHKLAQPNLMNRAALPAAAFIAGTPC